MVNQKTKLRMRSIRIGGRSISYDMGNNFEPDSGTGSVCSDYFEDVDVEKEVVKKMIKPDILTMSKLLNFDEVRWDDMQFYY